MQPIKTFAGLLLALAAAGCQTSVEQPVVTQAPPDRCETSAVRQLIGERATPELLDKAREQSGAMTARIIRPDDVVTLEYNGQRLTLYTDEALQVQRISCG